MLAEKKTLHFTDTKCNTLIIRTKLIWSSIQVTIGYKITNNEINLTKWCLRVFSFSSVRLIRYYVLFDVPSQKTIAHIYICFYIHISLFYFTTPNPKGRIMILVVYVAICMFTFTYLSDLNEWGVNRLIYISMSYFNCSCDFVWNKKLFVNKKLGDNIFPS